LRKARRCFHPSVRTASGGFADIADRETLVSHFIIHALGGRYKKPCFGTSVLFFLLLTPALSSFGEERDNYFVGRLPRAACFAAFAPGYFLSLRWSFG
jgi:hypothetical protein